MCQKILIVNEINRKKYIILYLTALSLRDHNATNAYENSNYREGKEENSYMHTFMCL